MTNEQKIQISSLRGDGYGYARIAAALGLTKNQVAAFCRREGLSGTKSAIHSDVPDIPCCKNCGKPLPQSEGTKPRKFCSGDCRQAWWNAHPEAVNRKAVYSFTCACCNKPFTAYGNARRRYCSHACYIADRFKGGERHE